MNVEFKKGLDRILKIINTTNSLSNLDNIEPWAYKALKFICVKYSKNFEDFEILIKETIEFKRKKLEELKKNEFLNLNIKEKKLESFS